MRINVTAAEVCAGIRRSTKWCPIILAVKRATGRVDAVIGCGCIWLDPYDTGRYVALPWQAADWSEQFDRGCDLEPFSFDLEC